MTDPMWGAAPRARRASLATLVVAFATAVLCGNVDARINPASAERADVWGIEVTAESLPLLDDLTARRARVAGVNTLLVGTKLTPKQTARSRKIARRHGFGVVSVADDDGTSERASSCSTRSQTWCVLNAASLPRVAALAGNDRVDAIVFKVRTPADFKPTQTVGIGAASVIALVELRGKPRRSVWSPLIAAARGEESLQLAVAPAGPSREQALTTYLSYLSASDVAPPSTPKRLAFVTATENAIELTWQQAHDNKGVVSYGMYRGDTRVAESTQPSFRLGSLACGTTYTIGVDAVDAAGNRSKRSTLQASTSPCVPTATADTSPPTTPQSISTSGANQTSFSRPLVGDE